MFKGSGGKITDPARFFLEPSNTTHRQYEALRAYYVDHLPSADAALRFGYTPGSFRVLCHQFLKDPARRFFQSSQQARAPLAKQPDPVRDKVVQLRKQNLSIYDISADLKRSGSGLSPVAVSMILKDEGFARLPRRRDDERAGVAKSAAEVADCRALDLSERQFRTSYGGLFLFVPMLASLPFDTIMNRAGLPGSVKVEAGHAMRSLLGLKLFGSARHSHAMADVFDEGLALFAGLNVIPKRSFLTEYSCRIDPACYPKLMQLWFDAIGKLGLGRGSSFDLDFHTIPFHGEDALVEKHYVSRRSRRQKGMLAFLARDADRRVFCYANAEIRKGEQNDEILRFVEFWKKRTGRPPQELVFDSKLTTYPNLSKLNQMGIDFTTLRRRTRNLLQQIHTQPLSAWRRVELDGVSREYRTPRVLDQTIQLAGYKGAIRQLCVTDLGHEEPTLILTNQLRKSAAKIIERYARRMLIENGIADGVEFYHMDALSSAVAMKINCDLQLTLMASSLYRLLAATIGEGYETAKSSTIFRNFIDATATIAITNKTVTVRFAKRANNPLLRAAGLQNTDVPIPWLGGRRLRLVLGESAEA
jgi:hypothetical protein